MTDYPTKVDIAIIGSGPAGLSAGGRAAALGLSHVVLEKSDRISETVSRYQRNKLVMATPLALPARGGIDFQEGSREEVLALWESEIRSRGINVRLNAEVTSIGGEKGAFTLTLGNGDELMAQHIVLALGVQGNIRELDISGADWDGVQYGLDDAAEHVGEKIVVIGAGDSGLENALALAEHNTVTLVNRSDDLVRAKRRNAQQGQEAIDRRRIAYYSEARPMRITPGNIELELKSGATAIDCDLIIARLGASPPRGFLAGLGISFHGDAEDAPPIVDTRYESNLPGIYIIGSLCGFPLIKHAVNQGYEVIDFICGNDVEYADEPLLREKLKPLLNTASLGEILDGFREKLPLVASLTELQLREFLLDVEVREVAKGTQVFQRDDYGDSVYLIYRGSALGMKDSEDIPIRFEYPEGDYFGEIGLVAGRRRIFSVTAEADDNVFIEVPRSACLKWSAAVRPIRDMIERSSISRELRAYLSTEFTDAEFDQLLGEIDHQIFKAGDYLYRVGEEPEGIFIIRKGSVTVSQQRNGLESAISYVPAGNYLGETSLLSGGKRSSNVIAAVECRTIFIPAATFNRLIETQPNFRLRNERKILDQISENEAKGSSSISVEQIISQGLGEATDMLFVDENLCIRCYNCERACAETHGGTSRLNLKAGTTMGDIRIPTSCRHCEHPHCMSDCPTDAIRRSAAGEVLIDDNCIGCGNCVQNCPYGVIRLESSEDPGASALDKFLRRLGLKGDTESTGVRDKELAVKCDMCADFATGPACVNACPTGAALRTSPEKAFDLVDAR